MDETFSAAVAALPRNFGALGRYVLLETIGHGGMGVVWQAYDPVLDRKIALKLLAPSSAARGNLVAEAQAMARVQHPNVVTVYDAGVQPAGEHELAYVAMELVAGRTLKQWLGDPDHSPEARLNLFVLAGRGLEAAHAAGLVHRDFKPSNVLLGDDGRVRVSDFGLAVVSVVDDARTIEIGAAGVLAQTAYSPFAGTPRYMSPEQLHGLPADARSDQFAFCVALYEAIFGAHPFAIDDVSRVAELRDKVLQLPTPPVRSQLAGRVAPALLCGLAADPARRWGSMRELLDALEAARGTRGKRLIMAGAVAALIATVGAVGFRDIASPARACRHATDALAATWRPELRQSLQAGFAQLSGNRAEVWQHIAQAIDDWAARWRTLRVEQCEADRNGTRPSPTLTARRECLERRLGELGGLVQVLEKPDVTVASYASRAAHSLTPPESCLSALPSVDANGAPPPPRASIDPVRAIIDRAAALQRLGKEKLALEEAKAAAAAAERLHWTPLTSEAQLELGRAFQDVSQTNLSQDAFYQAMWAAETARDDLLRFDASIGLFKSYLDASDYVSAARWHESTRAIARHLPADGLREARLAFDDVRLALYRGQFKRCAKVGEEALRLVEKAAPGSVHHVDVLINVSRCYSLEQEDVAVAYLEKALPMSQKLHGHEDQQIASILTELGVHARRAHHYDAALKDYREALAIREVIGGADIPDCAGVHNNIGNVLRELKRYDESKAELERAIDIWTKSWGPDSPAIAVALGGLGRIALAQGRPNEALPPLRRALEITRKKRPPGHPDLVSDTTLLAQALLQAKRPEAVALFEEALAGVTNDPEASAQDRAEARFGVARARVELGVRSAGALELARAACQELDTPTSKDALAECRGWLTARSGAAHK